MYRITETDDFRPLSQFYHDNGLEVEIGEAPEGTLKNWRCEEPETGKLLAAATLQKRDGCYVLADLAVCEEKRKTGLGSRLLGIAEEEVIELGGREMWLVGKVPEFYKQFGWTEMNKDESPDISKCQTCDDFGSTCFPSIMKKVFKER